MNDTDAIGGPRRFLETRELVVLALVGALVAVSKFVTRLPLKIPGHSGIVWIAILVVGRALVRKPWAGSLMGFTAGVLAVGLTPGSEGVLVFMKYFAAGATLDLVAPLIGDRFDDPLLGGLAGGLAHLAKLGTDAAVGWALGIPAGFVALGLGIAALSHLGFGVAGGAIGALVASRLERSGLPLVRRLREDGDRR
jgi:hypothetical protein